tara:strand:+ start:4885 stop:6651 length:1767 start_codon:yes stop_codon:yes gene_type:complete
MSYSNGISGVQNKIYEYLVAKGRITSQVANNQPVSESMGTVIPDAIRVCKDDEIVAEAAASIKEWFYLVATEEGIAVTCAKSDDGWVLYSDVLCLVNPFDKGSMSAATQWARNEELSFNSIGVVSNTYLSQLKAMHGYTDEASEEGVNSKLALQTVDEIIRSAAALDASDIHFQPTLTDKFDVLFRIDGVLRVQKKVDSSLHDTMVRGTVETKCAVQFSSNTAQDGKFAFNIDQQKSINLRVSTMPVVCNSGISLKMVLRLLGNNSKLTNINSLGLSDSNLKLLQKLGSNPNGMIIATGPTGSGKTTTLNALLLDIYSRNPNQNFHTIEDPVEFQHLRMSHSEVSPSLSLNDALRALLRQDPDVVMVGEMRDNETAELGFKAAQTGHLVISTLHTNNTHESIGRLARMNIDMEMIVTNTSGIIAQRLVRTLCKSCKIPYSLKEDSERLAVYGKHEIFNNDGYDATVYRANPNGCKVCGEGFSGGEKGRTNIIEILEITPDVQVSILEGVNPSILRRKQMQEATFRDMWDDGLRLVKNGIVGFEQLEATLKSYDHDRVNVNRQLGSGDPKQVKVNKSSMSDGNTALSII